MVRFKRLGLWVVFMVCPGGCLGKWVEKYIYALSKSTHIWVICFKFCSSGGFVENGRAKKQQKDAV